MKIIVISAAASRNKIFAAENLTGDAVLVSRCGLADEKIFADLEAHKADRLNYLSTILTRRSD